MEFKYKYVAMDGDEYPCNIINTYDGFVDIEIDPQVEETTFFKVRKHMVVGNV